MNNLNSTHIQKTVQIDYSIWQKVRKVAFDREISIKTLVGDILTGKTEPIQIDDL
jgi:hypothetical protein